MLLIRHHKRQTVVIDAALDQGMGADDNLGVPALDPVIGPSLLLCRHRPGEKLNLDLNAVSLEQSRDRLIMLPRQHLSRRHHSALISIQRRSHQCQYRHDRLAGADVSLLQHGHSRIA